MSFEDSLFIFCLIVLSVLGEVSVRTGNFQSFGNFLTFIDLEIIEFSDELVVAFSGHLLCSHINALLI